MVVLSSDGSSGLERLRQFYREFTGSPNNLRYAAAEMLSLLDQIESVKCDDSAWTCSTSHLTLNLQSVDDPCAWISIHSDGLGHVRNLGNELADKDIGEYQISYEMCEEMSPWPGSTVRMVACNVMDAIKVVEIAAAECARSR